ncbi:MAG: hypothetical protein K9M44_04555 [Candidatus Pacebacteria bacterium]|nr:hypothetical protein [Candidatus Paceibacterota bacterium]
MPKSRKNSKKSKKNNKKIKDIKKLLLAKVNFKLYLWLVFAVLCLFLVFTVYNFYLITQIKTDLKNNPIYEGILEEKNTELKTGLNEGERGARQGDIETESGDAGGNINKEAGKQTDNKDNDSYIPKKYAVSSFGDNFSSSAYLDTNKTNMYLDEIITALTFEPDYKLEKMKDCSSVESCASVRCRYAFNFSGLYR